MSKAYKCPVCSNEVDAQATVCSNASCRAELGFCSHCRDITTYTLAEERKDTTRRNVYRCDRCQRLGVKCYTWLSGGYCNGMARAGSTAMPLCASCTMRVGEVARNVGLSRPHFFALFKEQTSLTPNVYWNTLRMEEALRQVECCDESLTAVACNLGFTTQGNFTRFFRDHAGVPPTLYREAARTVA